MRSIHYRNNRVKTPLFGPVEAPLRKFLLVDANQESSSLILNTLIREFPTAEIQHCESDAAATLVLAADNIDLVVMHCTLEHEGIATLRALRRLHTTLPIVVLSGVRSEAFQPAGATVLLLYEAWAKIGTVIKETLARNRRPQ
jgi:response regulator RpfG family c-di-GMP phosphodiesterase